MWKGDIGGNIKEIKRDEEFFEEIKSLNKIKNVLFIVLL